jgi:putative transposase
VALEVMPGHIHLSVKHGPKSSSYSAASVGASSATTVQRYIDNQWERPWKKAREDDA